MTGQVLYQICCRIHQSCCPGILGL